MAPIIRKADKDYRVDAALGRFRTSLLEGVELHTDVLQAFARRLEDLLSGGECPPSLKAQLCKEIDRVGLIHNAAANSKKVDLDKQGTKLWNLASKIKTQKSNDAQLLCQGTATFLPSLDAPANRPQYACLHAYFSTAHNDPRKNRLPVPVATTMPSCIQCLTAK